MSDAIQKLLVRGLAALKAGLPPNVEEARYCLLFASAFFINSGHMDVTILAPSIFRQNSGAGPSKDL
jgi:hypothetical protein